MTTIVRGLPLALSVITRFVVFAPLDVGVKVILIWQVTPDNTEPPQSLLVENMAASPVENTTLDIVMVVEP